MTQEERGMSARLLSLKEIFMEGDRFYQVPKMQRPYAWKRDHLRDLIDDLSQAFKDDLSEYFCGSIVLVLNEKDKRYELIDGQQRLTSFTILFCVFRDAFNEKIEEEAMEMIQKAIRDKYKKEDGDKLKFLTDTNEQNKFSQSVLNKINWQGYEAKTIEKSTRGNRYLKNAYRLRELIEEKFKEKDFKDFKINDFVLYIFRRVLLTFTTCKTQERAIDIFNVLNNRGLKLSVADILKSNLMQKLKSEEDARAFNTHWKQMEKSLNKKDSDKPFNDFLAVFAYYYENKPVGRRTDKSLLESFEKEKEKNKEFDPLSFIKVMDDFLAHYKEMDSKAQDRYIVLMRTLNNKNHWKTIMSTASFVEYKEFDELKKYLMAFFYQFFIAGKEAPKELCGELLLAVKHKRKIEAIKELIKNYMSAELPYENIENFLHSNLLGEKKELCRSLLFLVEYFLSDEGRIFVESKIHLEHILPKNPRAEWTKYFSKTEVKNYLNRLGNLTLLFGKTNEEISNASFAYKKEKYKSNKRGERVSFEITGQITKYEEWTKEAIEERQKYLMQKIKERLDLFS